MIKLHFDQTSKKTFWVQVWLTVIVMLGFLTYELSRQYLAMNLNLQERANAAAQRVSLSVSTSIWEVFQESENRQYADEISAKILDSELQAPIIQSISVYGNFGHLMTARAKINDKVESISSKKVLDNLITKTGKIRHPVHQGTMTIGHIEVYYTNQPQLPRLHKDMVRTAIIYMIFTALLIYTLWLLLRTSQQKVNAQQALDKLTLTQRNLIESEKMAVLGGLVARVAHEINTPLGIAVTSSSLIKDSTAITQHRLKTNSLKHSSLTDYLESVAESSDLAEKGLNRVIELVANFKQVAVDQNVEDVRLVNLNEYVKEVINTLSFKFKNTHCNIIFSGNSKLSIESIPGAIAQVITNLVNNALLHAFENVENRTITIDIFSDGLNHACIIFKDNGVGMSEEDLKRLYDPFFTTKRGKGGTGLGMNIVYNTVTQKLKGSINTESVKGYGTRYEIKLPNKLN